MDASIFEWLFFGGPVELMVGIPIVLFIVAMIFGVLKAGWDALFGSDK